MNDERIIEQLYKDYWKYMISKDADGLRSIMSGDYILMHMTGTRQSADVLIKGLMDGTFNYYSAAHDSIEVRVDKDTATMTGKSRVVAAVYGGSKGSWRLRGDFKLRKKDGKWKLTFSKASTY